MRASVTGARGFIGRRLVEKLLSAGHSVTILTRTGEPKQPGGWIGCLYPDAYLLQLKAQREQVVIAPLIKTVIGEKQ